MTMRRAVISFLVVASLLALPSVAAAATPAPAWSVQSLGNPTNFGAGNESGSDSYSVYVTNSGGAPTNGVGGEAEEPITITDTLPVGLTVGKVQLFTPRYLTEISKPIGSAGCHESLSGGSTTISCVVTELKASVSPASPGTQTLSIEGSVSGTFTLSFEGQTTAPIEYRVKEGVEAATIQAALESLSTIGAGQVEVNGATGPGPFTVTFKGALAGTSDPIGASAEDVFEPARLDPGNQLILKISVRVPPNASGPLVNRVEVEGGHASPVSWQSENQVGDETAAPAGFEEFRAQLLGADGASASAAGSHPYSYVTSFAVNTAAYEAEGELLLPARGDLKEIDVALPPGLASNPTAVERCTQQQFTSVHTGHSVVGGNFLGISECPYGSAVGLATVQQLEGGNSPALIPLYNLVPPKGMPAQLGFLVEGLPVYINTKLRSDSDYGVTAYLENTTQAQRVTAARITIWGTPWDPSHDTLRAQCAQLQGNCPVAGEPRAFMRLPSSCQNPLSTTFSFTTWALPVTGASASSTEPAPAGCAAVPFEPAIEARPTTNVADSPAGLHFDLHIPQSEGEAPGALGQADLREAVVTLPPGLVVNPASADGLASCAPGEVGLSTPPGQTPAHFDLRPAGCPNASKLGIVEAVSPDLDHPLMGAAYLATQEDNPFTSLISFYIVLEDEQSGIVVKLPAKVSLDQATGQVTTTVPESPQLPVEDFRFDFFKGARAPLRTPQTCGTDTTTSTMTPWSAPEGASAFPSASFQVVSAPGGGACAGSGPQLPNSPKLQAGTIDPTAGAYSPFALQVRREDGSQEIKGLDLDLPGGLLGRLAGHAECSEAEIAAARSGEHPGGGAAELAHPSCPKASEVGTVEVAAGAGPNPFHVRGPVYLAGPYEGAPLSLAIIIPAVAGPFDLGSVVARTALQVDPLTARVHVVDRHPYILDGIPLDIRTISVQTKPGFILNPTGCEPKALEGSDLTVFDQRAPLSNRFQVTGCGALGFKPSLKLSLKGPTRRTGHPAVHAVVTYPKQGAYSNIASAQVSLPPTELLDQGSLSRVCTQPELKSQSCPAKSVYGHAKAWTPLLDKPLEGPVYLAVGFGYQLPALVAELDGQIRVLLVGKVDTGKNHGIRNTFSAVPDAPVEKFELSLKGGPKYGLIENSEGVCRKPQRLAARFVAQNGKSVQLHPKIANSCGKKSGDGKHHKKGKGHKGGAR